MGKAHVQGSHGKAVSKTSEGENGFGDQNAASHRAHERRQEQAVGRKPERAGRRIRTAHDSRIPCAVDGGMDNKQKKEQRPGNLVNRVAGVTIRHEKQKEQQHGAIQRQTEDLIRAHGRHLIPDVQAVMPMRRSQSETSRGILPAWAFRVW